MSVALKRFDVVVLFVADLDRATAFYQDTLGLALKSQAPQPINSVVTLLTET